jgi:hypothetical protein
VDARDRSTLFLRRTGIGGLRFDESLGRGARTPWGSGEGTDFVLRLLERGDRVFYDPSLTVVHPPRVPPYGRKANLRAYDYGRGMGRVLELHRYGPHEKARYLAGPLMRSAGAAVRLKPLEAGYHASVLRGRLEGML